MTAQLHGQIDQGEPGCPRCGAPSSETSVLCERCRVAAIERQSRWRQEHRPARRAGGRCVFCDVPSSTYRCKLCKAKRRRWDLGLPVGDLQAPGPAADQEQGGDATLPAEIDDQDEPL